MGEEMTSNQHSERLRELLSTQPAGEGVVILSEDECLDALDDLNALVEQLEASERRASRNASAADIYKKQAEENGKAAIREEHRAETLEEQKEAADRVVEAARLLTRRDTFDMRIVKVREDNLMDALREYDAASSPATNREEVSCDAT